MHPLVRTVAEYGILLVFVNVLLEQLGLPIPAAPTLIVAGALSVRGGLRLVDILAVAVGASLLRIPSGTCSGAGWASGS